MHRFRILLYVLCEIPAHGSQRQVQHCQLQGTRDHVRVVEIYTQVQSLLIIIFSCTFANFMYPRGRCGVKSNPLRKLLILYHLYIIMLAQSNIKSKLYNSNIISRSIFDCFHKLSLECK